MGCLTGCISKYQCGIIKKAIDTEALAPFVTVRILGGNAEITVGNESSPNYDNSAVIMSFQYGHTDGAGCRIEIVDEEGGAFQKFFDKIMTDMNGAANKYVIEAEWGWVGSMCNSTGEVSKIAESKKHHFILLQVDIKFEQTMQFVLECGDLGTATTDSSRHEKAYGTADSPMRLKDALKAMFANNNPPIKNVKYLRRTKSGGISTWEFKDDPKGVWIPDQQHFIAVAKKWIRGYTTDGDKGIFIAWDDSEIIPTIVLWEDGQPRCNELRACQNANNIGTYIVNGGPCTPVISFNPRIKWPILAVQRTGGNPDGKVTATNWKKKDGDECNFEDEDQNGSPAGLTTTDIIPEHVIRNYGKESMRKFRIHDKRHGRANSPIMHPGISADLVIQGDPTLDDPIKMRWAYAAIVVINPFHLDKQNCPEWMPSGGALATSTCNEVMSNDNWHVLGYSHEIRLGSYTTTLKVTLDPPGAIINRDMPMGASPTGYNVPR